MTPEHYTNLLSTSVEGKAPITTPITHTQTHRLEILPALTWLLIILPPPLIECPIPLECALLK